MKINLPIVLSDFPKKKDHFQVSVEKLQLLWDYRMCKVPACTHGHARGDEIRK